MQIALASGGAVLLGDSRTPEGSVVCVTTAAWLVFLQVVRSDELD